MATRNACFVSSLLRFLQSPVVMGYDVGMNAPAGWYPDPDNASQQRFWSGEEWTDKVDAPLVPAPVVPAVVMPAPPNPQTLGQACAVCGEHSMVSRQEQLTEKKRVKFGVVWILATILTGGLGLVLWLVWPRSKQVIGVDRYLECRSCKARV